MVLVLLSALVERFSVSHMQDFWTSCHQWQEHLKTVRINSRLISYCILKWWIQNGYVLQSGGVASGRVGYKQG